MYLAPPQRSHQGRRLESAGLPSSRSAAASRAILKKTLRPPLSPSLETKQIEFSSFDWLQRADLAASASRHGGQKLRLQRRPRRRSHTGRTAASERASSQRQAAPTGARWRLIAPEKTPFLQEDRGFVIPERLNFSFFFCLMPSAPLQEPAVALEADAAARMRGAAGEQTKRRH